MITAQLLSQSFPMKYLISACLLLVVNLSFSQAEIWVAGKHPKGLYLNHVLSKGQTFYSLGRTYNIPPALIASFNDLKLSSRLSVGREIMIPLTESNFSQSANSGIAVHHRVIEGQNLSDISYIYLDVEIDSLRSWNNISDGATLPRNLVIGYLVTPGKPIASSGSKRKKDDAQARNEIVEEKIPGDPDGGFFTAFFREQGLNLPLSKELTVTSGIFRTSSGWRDKKFYVLVNSVSPGTIVKLINPTNNRIAYAKVLHQMDGIRQNDGFDIRISDAAYEFLGITEQTKFILRLAY